jgi:hypothetical protein
MFKKKTVFITIEFADVPGLFDYPKHLPLPGIGERVIFNSKYGRVSDISHITEGSVSEIKITCSRL